MFYLGAQFEGPLTTRDKYLVANRIFHFPVRWDEIEKQPGIYTAPIYASDNIRRMNAKLGIGNYQFIIGTRTCPQFYARTLGVRNSPPRVENYVDYVNFIEFLIMTYNPTGIELWNEPEASIQASGSLDYILGGFGTDGTSYGEMVRTVYDILKPKYPATLFISGASIGLGGWDAVRSFVQLAKNAGMKSDYWSWHAYLYYGEVAGKPYKRRYADVIRFATEMWDIYQCQQLITECSLMRVQSLPEDKGHRIEQAEYLRYLINHRETMPVDSLLWYTLANNCWRHTDLVENNDPKPAYTIWQNG